MISSKDLVDALNDDDDLPYGAWNDQKGITARELARKIKPYEVSSHSVRIGDRTPKGYHLDQFEDAFKRFIPPDPGIYPQQCHNPDKHGDCGDIHPQHDAQMLREGFGRHRDPSAVSSKRKGEPLLGIVLIARSQPCGERPAGGRPLP